MPISSLLNACTTRNDTFESASRNSLTIWHAVYSPISVLRMLFLSISRLGGGRLLLALLLASGWLLPKAQSVRAAEGDLDSTFGHLGIAQPYFFGSEQLSQIAVQPDGKIVAVGTASHNGIDVRPPAVIVRFNADGTLDPTFADNGILHVPMIWPTCDIENCHNEASAGRVTSAEGVAIQSDGKIVIVGTIYQTLCSIYCPPDHESYGVATSNFWYYVARYNSDGTLDDGSALDSTPSDRFGTRGMRVLAVGNVPPNWPALGHAYSVTIQDDGKIVVAGTSYDYAINDGFRSNFDFSVARLNPDGSYDTTFGNNGQFVTNLDGPSFQSSHNDDWVYDVEIQGDGKIVLAGWSFAEDINFGVVRLNPNGTLDSTFGNGGALRVSVDGTGHFYQLAFQDDGKILLVGRRASSGHYAALVRLNTDGSLDTSFGSGGKVYTYIGASSDSSALGLAIQDDGKIVVTGSTGSDVLLYRYHADGSLDTTFGDGGMMVTDTGSPLETGGMVVLRPDGTIVVVGAQGSWFTLWGDYIVARYQPDGTPISAHVINVGYNTNPSLGRANSVALQEDGKIIAVGTASNTFAVVRYHQDGSPDNSFSGDGHTRTSISAATDSASGVALQEDGKLVVAGTANHDFALARYHADGSLDTSFDDGIGAKGIVTTDSGDIDTARGVALQLDGKIVVVGGQYLLRYETTGLLDTSFGDEGLMDLPIDGYTVLVQPDGKIVVVGRSESDLALVRYNTDGSLDNSFDNDGMVTTNVGANAIAYAATLQPDGKIVVAGHTSDNQLIVVARYDTNGALDTSFGTDGVYTFARPQIHVNSVMIQLDGKIVVGGFVGDSVGGNLLLLRLNADGSNDDGSPADTTPEDSFGAEGVLLKSDGLRSMAVALQPDGKFVAVGERNSSSFVLARIEGDTPAPALRIDDSAQIVTGGEITVSIQLTTDFGEISTLRFTVEYDQACLALDTGDGDDPDTLPDAFSNWHGDFDLSYTLDEGQGRLSIVLSDSSVPLASLPDGEILTIAFKALTACRPTPSDQPVTFAFDVADEPAPEFTLRNTHAVAGAWAGGEVTATYNRAPTDLLLSNATITENSGAGAIIGTLTTIDPDAEDAAKHSYVVVDGFGNETFTVDGDTLKAISNLSFEDASSYEIKLRSTDPALLSIEKSFTIHITDLDEAPTALSLSATTVDENQPAGTVVGSFTTSDEDTADAGNHLYELVSGDGDTHNHWFYIIGDTLFTQEPLDFGALSPTLSVRVRTTDLVGLSYARSFTLTLNDSFEPGAQLTLTNSSIAENLGAGAFIGTLETSYAGIEDGFVYIFVEGEQGPDNDHFTLNGNQLLAVANFNFEERQSYTVRIVSSLNGDTIIGDSFLITIEDVDESPTDITLSNATIAENIPAGTLVGTLSTSNLDPLATHSYSLVTGAGSESNDSFVIVGNELRTNVVFDFEQSPASHSIRIRTTKDGEDAESYEKSFVITIVDVNEAPTAVDDLISPDVEIFVGSGALVDVLANDSDPDLGTTLTILSVDTPASGTATIEEGKIRFDPADNANGTTSFAYTLSDGDVAPLTDTATVTVTYVADDSRGDCNADGAVNPEDFEATIAELFDTPHDAPWYEIYAEGFAGSPRGCDSNADQQPDVADLICTAHLAGGQACGEANQAEATSASLNLHVEVDSESVVATLQVLTDSVPIAAISLQLHYDPAQMTIDPADHNADGLPDALVANVPEGVRVWAQVDNDRGEIQVAVSAVALPITALPAGELVSITFERLNDASPDLTVGMLSAGTPQGTSLPLRITQGISILEAPQLYLPTVSR